MSDRLSATPIERDVVIVSGSDAAEYLQTQLTQDVLNLEDGESAWSYLLNPKSVITALVGVTRASRDKVILNVDTGYGAPIRKDLDQFLSRMDVSFVEDRWGGTSWRGPGALSVAPDTAVAVAYPWSSSEAVDALDPDRQSNANADRLTDEELAVPRIEARWPSMGAEIDGQATPAMTGIVEHTVSFTKGCYTGQEFVARVHYRDAKPPKGLVQIVFDADAKFWDDTDITIDGESVGTVTSIAPSAGIGLGYCKRSVVLPAEVRIGSTVASVS